MQEVFENIIEKLKEVGKLKISIHGGRCNGKTLLLGYSKGIENAIEIVKQEAEQYNNGWIPCSVSMPEPIRPVLVSLRNWMNDRYIVRVGRFHTDHWNTDEGIVDNNIVIAWMPLPEPYQNNGE